MEDISIFQSHLLFIKIEFKKKRSHMKNIFTILCMLSLIMAGDERIVLSIGGSNQKVHDIYFKFEEEGDGLIEISIDQISSRSSDFVFNFKIPIIRLFKMLTKLSNAEMRGLMLVLRFLDDNMI